jgi:hypothetical protein
MALLVDISSLSETQSDRALHTIYKAIHDHGDDDAIWKEMDSPFLRRLVELFTQRGLMRLDGFRKELVEWINGEKHRAGERPSRPDGMMQRWSAAELRLVKLYLETLPPEAFTLDDWMMVVDYLTMRYLPPDDLRTEAEWLSTRATLMGRVQANMESLSTKQADTVLAALPSTVAEAVSEFVMSTAQRAMLDYARVRAAENVQKLADDTRHRMRYVIAQHHEQQMLKIPGTPGQSLQTRLLDEFATLNRDWRRIAVTEAVEDQNQGVIANMKPGSKVKRLEHYVGACAFCKKIDGMVFNVVDPGATDKDDWTDVWVGKTNVGRSAAPRKRVGKELIPREAAEMWAPAAGVQHPHCRGRWLPVLEAEPGDDPDFAEWLRKKLEKKSAAT